MATKTKKQKRRVTTVQLPAPLLDALDRMAEAVPGGARSRNWLIEHVLTAAVEASAPRAADGEAVTS